MLHVRLITRAFGLIFEGEQNLLSFERPENAYHFSYHWIIFQWLQRLTSHLWGFMCLSLVTILFFFSPVFFCFFSPIFSVFFPSYFYRIFIYFRHFFVVIWFSFVIFIRCSVFAHVFTNVSHNLKKKSPP